MQEVPGSNPDKVITYLIFGEIFLKMAFLTTPLPALFLKSGSQKLDQKYGTLKFARLDFMEVWVVCAKVVLFSTIKYSNQHRKFRIFILELLKIYFLHTFVYYSLPNHVQVNCINKIMKLN